MRALVKAADSIGKGMCFSVAVTDPASGVLLASRQVHVSVNAGSPAASAQCSADINASLALCNSTVDGAGQVTEGSACCGSLRALGSDCLEQLRGMVGAEQDPALEQAL